MGIARDERRGGRTALRGNAAPIRVPYEAVIFDMDGVVTDTASVHAAAWKRLFDEFLTSRDPEGAPFDADADYRRYVMGAHGRTGSPPSSTRAGSGSRRAGPTTRRRSRR